VAGIATLEERMDDVRAVMDAVGSEQAAVFGISEGGPMSILFAATYPKRTSALVVYGSFPEFSYWWARFERSGASPGAVKALMRMNSEINISHVLPAIRVPTLILHRAEDTAVAVEGSRFMAERIPGAKYVELSGRDHVPMLGNADAILDEIEEFLTGTWLGAEPDRALLTVLFTDIVGSTERAGSWGTVDGESLGGSEREARGGAGLEHGQGPGSGIGASVPGPGHSHPKRNPGRVAPVRGHLLMEVLRCKWSASVHRFTSAARLKIQWYCSHTATAQQPSYICILTLAPSEV
jgi:hypothetical protein